MSNCEGYEAERRGERWNIEKLASINFQREKYSEVCCVPKYTQFSILLLNWQKTNIVMKLFFEWIIFFFCLSEVQTFFMQFWYRSYTQKLYFLCFLHLSIIDTKEEHFFPYLLMFFFIFLICLIQKYINSTRKL